MPAPVNEHLRMTTRDAVEPGNAASHMTCKAPVFSPRPVRQFGLDAYSGDVGPPFRRMTGQDSG